MRWDIRCVALAALRKIMQLALSRDRNEAMYNVEESREEERGSMELCRDGFFKS